MTAILEYLETHQRLDTMVDTLEQNLAFYEGPMATSEAVLASFYNLFVSECVKADQYVQLGDLLRHRIYDAYRLLTEEVRDLLPHRFHRRNLVAVVQAHRRRLIAILKTVENEGSGEIVPCAEYSVSLQRSLLRLSEFPLLEPILDVGCGRAASLVRSLREDHAEVYGLDQYLFQEDFLWTGDWNAWDYGTQKWGTIVSHMAFTNHCRNAVLSGDVAREEPYRQGYGLLLAALRPGGRFVYTPRIAVYEDGLDPEVFAVRVFPNSADRDLDTVMVVRRPDGSQP